MTTSTQSIVSIGKACELLQLPMARIRNTAAELEIMPALVINHIDHFAEKDLERIGQHVRQQRNPRGFDKQEGK